MLKNAFFIITILIFIHSSSYADRRYFSRSYMANSLPAKALEFELWNTGRLNKDSGTYYRFQPRLEFEYGITDRLTGSYYMNFNQVKTENNSYNSTDLSFESSSIELKYRLADPAEYFVDPALYFEVSYGGVETEYEGKLIVSKQYRDFVYAFNLSAEIERDIPEGKTESKFELTGGVMYEFTKAFAAGFEGKYHQNNEKVFSEKESSAIFLGPSLNVQTDKFYLSFNFLKQLVGSPGVAHGLDLKGHEQYEFRTIIGIAL